MGDMEEWVNEDNEIAHIDSMTTEPEMFRVIIAGTREFDNYSLLRKKIDNILSEKKKNPYIKIEVVSGTAKGADRLGEKWARENDIYVKQFPANWNKYGSSAGYRRNVDMVEYSDALIAFWNGRSKGTKHTIELATKKNILCRVIYY